MTSQDAGELLATGILSGVSRLVATKAGCEPKFLLALQVRPGATAVWEVGRLAVRPRRAPEGGLPGAGGGTAGRLVVESVPNNVLIEIPSLGISTRKGKDRWDSGDLPPGEHEVRVSGLGKSLRARIVLRPGGETKYSFDLYEGQVEDAGAREAREREESEVRRRAETEAFARKIFRDSGGIFEFLPVPAGEFEMGSTLNDDEGPVHRVRVEPFLIGRSEVTQAQWRKVTGESPSGFPGCDDCPVEQVSWEDIQEFLRKAGLLTGLPLRLPTEEEWEYAAGGGQAHQTFAGTEGGSRLWEYAWTRNNAGGSTHPVCLLRPNRFGLCDMSGNVAEWVEGSCLNNLGYQFVENPADGWLGRRRQARGGAWPFQPAGARVANRDCVHVSFGIDTLGFRIALTSPTHFR